MLTVFGYDHAPHGHGQVPTFENVRVPVSQHSAWVQGRGFENPAQGRVGGPGAYPITAWRCIGVAETRDSNDVASGVAKARVAFREATLAEQRHESAPPALRSPGWKSSKARSLDSESCVHDGLPSETKAARSEIAMIKVDSRQHDHWRCLTAPFKRIGGGRGVSQDTFLAAAWANVCGTLRLADGADEVHMESIAKHETGKVDEHNRKRNPLSKVIFSHFFVFRRRRGKCPRLVLPSLDAFKKNRWGRGKSGPAASGLW